jgi:dienelactone hydrolase
MPRVSRSIGAPAMNRTAARAITGLFIVCSMTLSACALAAASEPMRDRAISEAPAPGKLTEAGTSAELHGYLLGRKADVDLFRARGPFAVVIQEDRELRVTTSEAIRTDVFLSASAQKAPLVIFLHGDESSKRAHANQAAHLASWGLHSLAVQLPNRGPWDTNGRRLARLAGLVHRAPESIDKRIDRIILVGHSFGAFAVALALAEGAPAAGAILLDPAGVAKDLPDVLRRIRKPVLVLGADDEIATPRNRDYFYELIRGDVAEVSIRDAVHEDAQFPSEVAVRNAGVDADTTEALQVTFVSALTAAAISLSATGTLDYAWASYQRALQEGKLFNAKRK